MLTVHSPLQHFGVGGGSEMFFFLKIMKRQTIKVISSQTPALLIFVTKVTFNGTCKLHY